MNLKLLEQWKQRIEAQKSSGLSVINWCNKNNLSKHAYYYWKKRIASNAKKAISSTPVFVEISTPCTVPAPMVKADLHIAWKDINFTINDAGTAKLAAEFISRLRSLC